MVAQANRILIFKIFAAVCTVSILLNALQYVLVYQSKQLDKVTLSNGKTDLSTETTLTMQELLMKKKLQMGAKDFNQYSGATQFHDFDSKVVTKELAQHVTHAASKDQILFEKVLQLSKGKPNSLLQLMENYSIPEEIVLKEDFEHPSSKEQILSKLSLPLSCYQKVQLPTCPHDKLFPKRGLKVIMISTVLPMKCGIATFAHDVRKNLLLVDPNIQVDMMAITDQPEGYTFEEKQGVVYSFYKHSFEKYAMAADFIVTSHYDLLVIQHEYGIFGGVIGTYLIKLMSKVKQLKPLMPIVTNMHTLLESPEDPQMVASTKHFIELSDRIFTLSQKACNLMSLAPYHVPIDKCKYFPHGVESNALSMPSINKEAYGWTNRSLIATFGLVSRSKGIEYMIEAMRHITQKFPNALYLIIGSAPSDEAPGKESYLSFLKRKVSEYQLQNNVLFINKFLAREDIISTLSAVDVYITPYPDPRQISSGTITLALSLGLSIVSTEYAYAKDVLANERGVLVPCRDAYAMGENIIRLLESKTKRDTVRCNAFAFSKKFAWEVVVRNYICEWKRLLLAQENNRDTSLLQLKSMSLLKTSSELMLMASSSSNTVMDKNKFYELALFERKRIIVNEKYLQSLPLKVEETQQYVFVSNQLVKLSMNLQSARMKLYPLEFETYSDLFSGNMILFKRQGSDKVREFRIGKFFFRKTVEFSKDRSMVIVTLYELLKDEKGIPIAKVKIIFTLQQNKPYANVEIFLYEVFEELTEVRIILASDGVSDLIPHHTMFASVFSATDDSTVTHVASATANGPDVMLHNKYSIEKDRPKKVLWYGWRPVDFHAATVIFPSQDSLNKIYLLGCSHKQGNLMWCRAEYFEQTLRPGQSFSVSQKRLVVSTMEEIQKYEELFNSGTQEIVKLTTIATVANPGSVIMSAGYAFHQLMMQEKRNRLDTEATKLALFLQDFLLSKLSHSITAMQKSVDFCMEIVGWYYLNRVQEQFSSTNSALQSYQQLIANKVKILMQAINIRYTEEEDFIVRHSVIFHCMEEMKETSMQCQSAVLYTLALFATSSSIPQQQKQDVYRYMMQGLGSFKLVPSKNVEQENRVALYTSNRIKKYASDALDVFSSLAAISKVQELIFANNQKGEEDYASFITDKTAVKEYIIQLKQALMHQGMGIECCKHANMIDILLNKSADEYWAQYTILNLSAKA